MIDTNELRRLAQDQAWIGRWYDAGCETLMAIRTDDTGGEIEEIAHPVPTGLVPYLVAVQPSKISDLLGRLEAAEKERDALRAKIAEMEKMQDALRRHHEMAMGAGLDPSHSLTKLRVSAYQQTCLYADTVAALEESK